MLLDTARYFWILLLDTVAGYCCWILLDTAGYCWILLDTTGYYWILLDTIGYYWILLDTMKNFFARCRSLGILFVSLLAALARYILKFSSLANAREWYILNFSSLFAVRVNYRGASVGPSQVHYRCTYLIRKVHLQVQVQVFYAGTDC